MFTPGGQLDLLSFRGVRGGGGKGGSQQANPSPTIYTDPVDGTTYTDYHSPFYHGASASDQLNAHIADRKAKEQAASDAATAKSQQDAATAETTFQGSRQKAYDDALAAVQRKFQLQGVDPSSYMTSDIVPTLQRQFNSIQDLSPNPAAAFPDTLADSIIGNITSGKRTQANTALNQVFTPQYAENLIPDSTTNNFLDQILGEQFDPLSSQLVNAQKRGTLSDTGYKAALDTLNQKKSAARSTVQNLGNTILSTDRGDINSIVGNARSAASGLGLSDTFDPNTFTTQAQQKAASDIGNFGGALRSAVGDTKFASLQDLLNAGGSVQGAGNPTATNPNAAPGTLGGTILEDPLAQQKRGLGNAGAF